MSYSHFLCSYGSGSDPIINDDFLGGSVMGTLPHGTQEVQRPNPLQDFTSVRGGGQIRHKLYIPAT